MHRRLRLNYGISLFNAGRIGDAYRMVRQVRTAESLDVDLVEIEIAILERIGAVKEANELLSVLITQSPDRAAGCRVKLATNLLRSRLANWSKSATERWCADLLLRRGWLAV